MQAAAFSAAFAAAAATAAASVNLMYAKAVKYLLASEGFQLRPIISKYPVS